MLKNPVQYFGSAFDEFEFGQNTDGILELQSCTKYLDQSKNIKQNWTGAEISDNSFCVIFGRCYISFISGRKTGH